MENVVIVTPCFNENTTVITFLKSVENVVSMLPFNFEIVVVDDSSADNTLVLLNNYKFNAPNCRLTILPLKFNIGHQGAIYQGLLYAQKINSNRFIILDSDGEDDPNAITELVKFNDYEVVNIARGSRKENLAFKISYYIYLFIFKIITDKKLNFGNYCMINKRVLDIVCYSSFIHFPAFLSKQKVTTTSVVYNRLRRIDGKSKMNFTSLIHHAFKSFIEYADQLLMVFLKIFVIIMVMFFVLMGVVLYKKLFTNEAILGWASTMTLGLFTIAITCLGFFVTGILLLNMISKRNQSKATIYDLSTDKK